MNNNFSRFFTSSATNPVQARRDRNTLILLAILFAAVAAVAVTVLILALQTGTWQYYGLLGDAFFLGSVTGASFVLTRRGSYRPAAGAVIIGLGIAGLVVVSLFTGLGVVIPLIIVFINLFFAIQLLSGRDLTWGIVGALATGFVSTLTDIFFKQYQLNTSAIQNLYVIVTIVMMVSFIAFLFNQFRTYSIPAKLSVTFLIVALIPTGVLTYYFSNASQQALTEQADAALLGASSEVAKEVDGFLEEGLTDAATLSQLNVLQEYLLLPVAERAGSDTKTALFADLSSIANRNPNHIESVGLIDRTGIIVADTNPNEVGADHSKLSLFTEPINTKQPYVTPVLLEEGQPALTFSAPVLDAGGRVIGVLRIRYNANILQEIMANANGLAGAESFGILLDENYIRLAHGTQPDLVFKSVTPLDSQTLADLKAAGRLPDLPAEDLSTDLTDWKVKLDTAAQEPVFSTILQAVTGDQAVVAVAKLESQPWVVAYAQPEDVLYAPITTETRNGSFASLFITLLVAVLALAVSQQLSRPIAGLNATAQQVAGGDFSATVVVDTNDEIGELGASFNTMVARIREALQTVQQRGQEIALAAEVGRSVSQVGALEEVLRSAAEIIRERFDLYYVQVYLPDPSQTNLLLQAGTGNVGVELLGRGHRLTLNTASINGRAATEKRSVVIADTTASATFKPNPLLPDTRSEMAVPLLIGDKLVGVLDLQSTQANALNQEILPAFEALAGQFAIAIQNAAFLAETNQARAEVEAQARRLTRANWADYLDAIHKPEETGFVFAQNQVSPMAQKEGQPVADNALTASIAVTGEPLGNLIVEMAAGSPIARSEELVNTVARQVAQQIENLRLLDSAERYRAEAEEASRRLTREGWKNYAENASESLSYIYDLKEVKPYQRNGNQQVEAATTDLPLKIRDEVIGRLAIQGIETDDSESVELASAVAERLSLHIENLRQFDETQRGQIELDKRARQLASVAEVSSVSSRELDIDKMLQSVVDLTQRQFGLYHAHIFTLNENTAELQITACGWAQGDEHAGSHEDTVIPLAQERSLVARAARSKQAVIVNDVRKESGWLPNPLLPDTASEMAVPLVIGDQVLGVLDVQSDQVNAFSEEDANIQTTLASQVATALQNARSFTQAQRQAERESMLNVISQKIQSATTVEAVLQIAARELGHALGAPMTMAQLSIKDNKS